MTGPVCTPIDSGGLWCQTTVAVGEGDLDWRVMLLTYLLVLLVTWAPLIVGRRTVA